MGYQDLFEKYIDMLVRKKSYENELHSNPDNVTVSNNLSSLNIIIAYTERSLEAGMKILNEEDLLDIMYALQEKVLMMQAEMQEYTDKMNSAIASKEESLLRQDYYAEVKWLQVQMKYEEKVKQLETYLPYYLNCINMIEQNTKKEEIATIKM